ncbi:MAG: hypothetical protein QOK37_1015 [Thermoanaerobaculia bacterium]|jgi:hypothetical protein|nr:hypothetical protein [Thermoanaerobaculia bacterium]
MSFEGEIGEIDLIERLVELGNEQFTGAIRFENDGIIKIIYFKGGDVLSASTNDRTDAIDEILLRANKVTREHLKQALAKRKESETLGDALLGLGFITRKELTWARRVQVIGVIRSIIGWSAGSYTIVADYLPKREEGTLFSLAQIIVELIVTDNDRSKSEQAMESGNAIFEKSPQFDDAFRRLGLNEDAEQIVAQIDGSNSAAEVASKSGKDVFNVYKLLEALRALGLVTRSAIPPAQHEVSAAAAASAWEVENPDFTLDDDVSPAVSTESEEWAPSTENATMEIPAINAAAWEAAQSAPLVPARSVWDEPDVEDRFSETEVLPSLAAASVPRSELASEPQWGFDEAQIEAARRAEVPLRSVDDVPTSHPTVSKPAKPRSSHTGLWIAILVVLLLGAAAYPAWQWWEARNAPEPVVVYRPTKHPKLTPPAGVPASMTPTTVQTTAPLTSSSTTTSPSPATSSSPTRLATTPAIPLTATPKTATQSATITPTSASPLTTARQPLTPVTATTAKTTPERRPLPPSIKQSSAKPSATPANTPGVAPHLERTAGGAATITNTTAAASSAPSSDAARAKYDGMARDFAAQKDGKYTVQFELVCETASVTRALNAARDKVWFAPISYRGRPCYRVFWGRFETSAEAVSAAKQMPASPRSTPVVVKIPR